MNSQATKKIKTNTSVNIWLRILKTMFLGRLTEERLVRLYHQGKIFGGVYTGIGQEAIGAVSAHIGTPDDLYAPAIRNVTVHLGRGTKVLDVFRQYLGRVTGPTRGRDGNVHYGEMDKGVFAMVSHMGAMLSVLVGGVMARRRLGKSTMGFAYIGDGASSTGDFHEALNFASVFDVPILFMIENNHYAYSTPKEFQYRCQSLVEKACGYGMEGLEVDGNDVIKLYDQIKIILGKIRKNNRPVLIVCDTMRMRGHGEHDDASYVPKELLQKYKEKDPIHLLKKYLLNNDFACEQDLKKLEKECLDEINQSYKKALSEPMPSPDDLLEGVYAED